MYKAQTVTVKEKEFYQKKEKELDQNLINSKRKFMTWKLQLPRVTPLSEANLH